MTHNAETIERNFQAERAQRVRLRRVGGRCRGGMGRRGPAGSAERMWCLYGDGSDERDSGGVEDEGGRGGDRWGGGRGRRRDGGGRDDRGGPSAGADDHDGAAERPAYGRYEGRGRRTGAGVRDERRRPEAGGYIQGDVRREREGCAGRDLPGIRERERGARGRP